MCFQKYKTIQNSLTLWKNMLDAYPISKRQAVTKI